jgi:hypothetical protein
MRRPIVNGTLKDTADETSSRPTATSKGFRSGLAKEMIFLKDEVPVLPFLRRVDIEGLVELKRQRRTRVVGRAGSGAWQGDASRPCAGSRNVWRARRGGGRSAANARDAALSIVVDDGGECGRRDDDG